MCITVVASRPRLVTLAIQVTAFALPDAEGAGEEEHARLPRSTRWITTAAAVGNRSNPRPGFVPPTPHPLPPPVATPAPQ